MEDVDGHFGKMHNKPHDYTFVTEWDKTQSTQEVRKEHEKTGKNERWKKGERKVIMKLNQIIGELHT
jgi:hypothetical protein